MLQITGATDNFHVNLVQLIMENNVVLKLLKHSMHSSPAQTCSFSYIAWNCLAMNMMQDDD